MEEVAVNWSGAADALWLLLGESGAVMVVLLLIAVSIGVTLLLSTTTSTPDTD